MVLCYSSPNGLRGYLLVSSFGWGQKAQDMLQDEEMVPQITPKSGELQDFCFTKLGVQVWGQRSTSQDQVPPPALPQAALNLPLNTCQTNV